MGRYRKVDTRIWADEKFRSFSDDTKLVFLFILTHRHLTPLGAMNASLEGLAAELRWEYERFKLSTLPLIERNMLVYDDKHLFLYLPNFIKYNAPDNPNVAASWRDHFKLLQECPALFELEKIIHVELSSLGEPYIAAWTHGEKPKPGAPSLDVMRQVRARDGSRCQYCGQIVNWSDRRGEKGATYDHVHPRGPSTIENIVVSCRKCNSMKGLRNPEESGMFPQIQMSSKLQPKSYSNNESIDRQVDPSLQEQEPELKPELEQIKKSTIYSRAENILNFLNEKANKNFPSYNGRGNPTTNLQLIIDRLKDGYNDDQCRALIAVKVREWKGVTRENGQGRVWNGDKYLRPSTLFRKSNFETYLGEVGRKF